jgi:hypothetical protein
LAKKVYLLNVTAFLHDFLLNMNSANLQEKLFDAPNIFDRGKDLGAVPPSIE